MVALTTLGLYSAIEDTASMTIETEVKLVYQIKISEDNPDTVVGFNSASNFGTLTVNDVNLNNFDNMYVLVKTNSNASLTIKVTAEAMKHATDGTFIDYAVYKGSDQIVNTPGTNTGTLVTITGGSGLRVIPTEFRIEIFSSNTGAFRSFESASTGKYVGNLKFDLISP